MFKCPKCIPPGLKNLRWGPGKCSECEENTLVASEDIKQLKKLLKSLGIDKE